MAEIILNNLAHSYQRHADGSQDWVLKDINLVWQDGGCYALLGPSGCGKTTLLNIISGLLTPSEGGLSFDGIDVSAMDANARNIAQVFQFPVVYDTMTVFQNLAFPLRNRGLDKRTVASRVNEIAEMLEISDALSLRASGLTAADKQKISLGRGLVRSDVNVIMFDEPLTVIDPHLKWQLRAKLKQLHRRFGFTMIYVTHDQAEAMTLADQIVVLHQGRVVQSGSPEALFEYPEHTFVGHFIGSPGMNCFPANIRGGRVHINAHEIAVDADLSSIRPQTKVEIGIRPEHIKFSSQGLPITICAVKDIGRYKIITADLAGTAFKIYLPEDGTVPTNEPCATFDRAHTHLYLDGRRHQSLLS